MRKFPLINQKYFVVSGLAGAVLTALSLYLILEQFNPARAQSRFRTNVIPESSKLNEIGPAKQSKAVGYAESGPVRDLKPRKASNKPGILSRQPFTVPNKNVRQTKDERSDRTSPIELQRDELEKLREQNAESNPEIPGNLDANLSAIPSVLPTPSVNFAGISVFDTVPLGQGFMPPDTSGEAGPNHYVQTVNVAFRVWSKSGVPLTPSISLGDLFAPLPGPCSGSLGGSGTVIYDQLADRWVITQRCFETRPMHALIAVSTTGDPTGAYFLMTS